MQRLRNWHTPIHRTWAIVSVFVKLTVLKLKNCLNTFVHLEAQFEFGIYEPFQFIGKTNEYLQPNSTL